MPQSRSRTVTFIGVVFVVAGLAGLIYHAPEWAGRGGMPELAALAVRTLAVVCGVGLLRGQNWARWLAVLWLAYHVVLSTQHSMSETVAHAVLLLLFGFLLFRPGVSDEFGKDASR